MKKIINSIIAVTAAVLNLGHSQFAVHSIIDSSGAYSFNYYEHQSWTVIPSLLLTDPNKHQSCQFTSKLWGEGNENKTINITSDSVKLVILLKKAANTKITHRYQSTIRIPELNFNLPGLYICYDDHKRIKEKKGNAYAIGVIEKFGSDNLLFIVSKYPIEVICPALRYGL